MLSRWPLSATHVDTAMATPAAVRISDLLASAFSSTLGSTVVTYDRYKQEKDEETVNFQALNIDQLFLASHLCGNDLETSQAYQ